MRLGFYVVLLAGCGSSSASVFGTVTEDGKAAIHEWCKERLEMESNLRLSKKGPVFDNPDLLVMHCYNAGHEAGDGWVAIDTKTDKLWDLALDLHPSNFDRIVDRVLVPALDSEQRAALDEFRALLKTPTAISKIWSKGKTHIIVNTYPNTNASEPTWFIAASYRQSAP